MYLQQPRGHVRQRSTGTEVYTEPRILQELQVAEPLLNEVNLSSRDITYRFGQERWSDATLGILWVLSLLVVALGTFSLSMKTGSNALGSFARGYATELVRMFQA